MVTKKKALSYDNSIIFAYFFIAYAFCRIAAAEKSAGSVRFSVKKKHDIIFFDFTSPKEIISCYLNTKA